MSARTLDPRTVADLRWGFREALHEEIGRVIRHGEYVQRYAEDGCDFLATFHLDQAKRCFKRALETHNELVDLGRQIGSDNE